MHGEYSVAAEHRNIYFRDSEKQDLGALVERDHRMYNGKVASCVDEVNIRAKKLDVEPDFYMGLASLTKGLEGTHFVAYNGTVYQVDVKGQVGNEEKHGIVRRIMELGSYQGNLKKAFGDKDFGNPNQFNRKVRKHIRTN